MLSYEVPLFKANISIIYRAPLSFELIRGPTYFGQQWTLSATNSAKFVIL